MVRGAAERVSFHTEQTTRGAAVATWPMILLGRDAATRRPGREP